MPRACSRKGGDQPRTSQVRHRRSWRPCAAGTGSQVAANALRGAVVARPDAEQRKPIRLRGTRSRNTSTCSSPASSDEQGASVRRSKGVSVARLLKPDEGRWSKSPTPRDNRHAGWRNREGHLMVRRREGLYVRLDRMRLVDGERRTLPAGDGWFGRKGCAEVTYGCSICRLITRGSTRAETARGRSNRRLGQSTRGEPVCQHAMGIAQARADGVNNDRRGHRMSAPAVPGRRGSSASTRR